MIDDLYNTDILTLAASIQNIGTLAPDQCVGKFASTRKVSKLCGSWLEIDLCVIDGEVQNFSLRLEACALGQASTSILSQHLVGATYEQVQTARDGLFALLKSKDGAVEILKQSRFSALISLSDIANYPARHISTLLAFDAAMLAFEQAVTACP